LNGLGRASGLLIPPFSTRSRAFFDLSLSVRQRCGAAGRQAVPAITFQRLNQITARLLNDGTSTEDMSMNEDRVVGTARNVGGQLEEGFGRVTGDVKSQVEGKIKQATGAAQDLYGQARDAAGDAAKAVQERAAPLEEALRNTIENRPYTAVAVALAVGWFVGRMSRMD
jgi:uncharacterized protein YjbJ (UPF0337 family)